MVFEIIIWSSGDIILEVHQIHCPNVWVIIISSITGYSCLINSEYSNLSEIGLLILEGTLSERSSECRFWIHGNGNSTNWRIVQNVFSNEPVFSGGNDKILCQSVQIVKLHCSLRKRVHFLFGIIIFESKTTSVELKINISKTNGLLSLII